MARGDGEGTIYKRKNGRWCGQITVGTNPKTGKPKRRTFYGDTRKEVAKQMTEAKHKLMTGTYIEPSNIKLSDWLDKWIEGRKPSIAYSTYSNYKTMIKNHINPDIGNVKLKDLRARQVQDLLNYKLEKGKTNGKGGLSTRTVKYIYQTLHAALEQAIKERLIPANICAAVEIPKKQEEKRLHTWSIKEVYKFLEVAKEYRYYSIYFLALNTGMRRGELLGLKWKDVFIENKRIEVVRQLARTNNGLEFKKVKTEAGNRIIPITDDVVKFLKSHRIKQNENKLALGEAYNDKDIVSCSEIGTPISPRSLLREFKKIIKAADLPEIRFHDLRHTFATLFIEAGGPIKTLQQILGHSSITVTIDTYSHVTDEMLIEAERKIETMFRIAKNDE
ncbi:tyrosine-type recombinase/integrase [Natronospora cellulosivora (SeqCode)]